MALKRVLKKSEIKMKEELSEPYLLFDGSCYKITNAWKELYGDTVLEDISINEKHPLADGLCKVWIERR